MPRVSLPADPASRRKHVLYATNAIGSRVAVEDLVAIEIRDRNFGGRNEEEVVVRDAVRVVLELRQLAGAGHRRAIHEQRRPHFLVAVLARVHVEEEVQQRADEPRAVAAIERRSPSR